VLQREVHHQLHQAGRDHGNYLQPITLDHGAAQSTGRPGMKLKSVMVKKLIFASKEGEFTQPWVVSQFEI
jgi:hypothetical protein